MVHETTHVFGHVRKFIAEGGLVAQPGSAIIKEYQRETLRKAVNEAGRPGAGAETVAHDENEGRPGSADIKRDRDAVHIDFCIATARLSRRRSAFAISDTA